MNNKPLIVAIVILAALIAGGVYYLSTYEAPQADDFKSLSPEEREKLMGSLTASSTSKLDKKEREAALDSLTTKNAGPVIPLEERKGLLESLQAE